MTATYPTDTYPDAPAMASPLHRVVAGLWLAAIVQAHAGSAIAADAARPRDLYIARCAACHQAGGDGLSGIIPALKGSAVVNKDDATKHIRVVLDGMRGGRVSGVVYSGVMPPFAATLSDADIASIINYERGSWGNHGKPITAAQVAAERKEPR